MRTHLAALQAELEAAGYVFVKDSDGLWHVHDGEVNVFPHLQWSLLSEAIAFTARAVGIS